ncbi:YjfK family protein [Marinomonas sp. 15G1-11]|uniref:YjfK family protein n=1 Tax=Marinomonas phaeophyticola TaxID=3004091 RepID=A0ABT4JST1_9GAMM|nr:YjfK family protein [Marinomonas sp. 15G1-11]MCZ2721452.1 YjfK family protein [Marinomonas sp. 15G1-11]
MFSSFFNKKKPKDLKASAPTIMGLRLGGSFEIDSLLMRMIEDQLTTKGAASTYIIKAVGIAELDGTWMFRFYTDDDAFLQVISEGGKADENVVDVKLFHFYDTQDVPNQFVWDNLLNKKMGTALYDLDGQTYRRVWTSASDYHNPVYIQEKTYDDEGETSTTDQFTMLFERDIADERTESLFLSAEESEDESGLSRCFVLSTGITLTPSQLTIHG